MFYILLQCWDTEPYWHIITDTGSAEEMVEYIRNNLVGMEYAMSEDDDTWYSLKGVADEALVSAWDGTPEELLDILQAVKD